MRDAADYDKDREARLAAALKAAVKPDDLREAARQQRIMADELDRCAEKLEDIYRRMRADLS